MRSLRLLTAYVKVNLILNHQSENIKNAANSVGKLTEFFVFFQNIYGHI